MLKIGYKHLSWRLHINTFDTAWEAIKLADRLNFDFVFDTLNLLAVENTNLYNPRGARPDPRHARGVAQARPRPARSTLGGTWPSRTVSLPVM